MAEMEEPVAESEQIELHPCGVCGRTFQPTALIKHEKICLKNATQKRKPFNSRAQRVAGTELAEFHTKAGVKKSGNEKSPYLTDDVLASPYLSKTKPKGEDLASMNNDLMALSCLNIDKIVNEETPIAYKEMAPPKITKTKPKSEIPVKGMEKSSIPKSKSKAVLDESPKVDRLTAQKMEKPIEEPPKVSVTPKRSTSSIRNNVTTPQGEKCPSCDRTFGLKAYERHVEWCKARQQRPQASPVSVQMAKERLAARTNYRAPIKKFSQRAINKEKYSSLKSESKSSLKRDSSVEREEELALIHTSRSLSRQASMRKDSTLSYKRPDKKGGENEKRVVSTQHTNNNSESNEYNSYRSNQQNKRTSLLDSSASTISTHLQRVPYEHDNNKINLSHHGPFDSPTPVISPPFSSGNENEANMLEPSVRVKKSKAGSKPLKINDVVVNDLVLGMTVTSYSKIQRKPTNEENPHSTRDGAQPFKTDLEKNQVEPKVPTKDGTKPRVSTYKVDIIKKNIENISNATKKDKNLQFYKTVSKKSEIPVRKRLVLAKDIEKALNEYKEKVMNGNGEMEEIPDFPKSGASDMIMKRITQNGGVVDFLETQKERDGNSDIGQAPVVSLISDIQQIQNNGDSSTDYSTLSNISSLEKTVEMHEQKFSDACSNYDSFVKNIDINQYDAGNNQAEENEKSEEDEFDELQAEDYEFTEIDGRICMKKKEESQEVNDLLSSDIDEHVLNQTWPSSVKNLENFRGTLEENLTIAAVLSPRNDHTNRNNLLDSKRRENEISNLNSEGLKNEICDTKSSNLNILDNKSNISVTKIVNKKICLYNDKSSDLDESDDDSDCVGKSLEENEQRCENTSIEKFQNSTSFQTENNQEIDTKDGSILISTEEDQLFEEQIKKNLQRYKEEFINNSDTINFTYNIKTVANIASSTPKKEVKYEEDEEDEEEEEPQRCVSVKKVLFKQIEAFDEINKSTSSDSGNKSELSSLNSNSSSLYESSSTKSGANESSQINADRQEINFPKEFLSPTKRLSSESFENENIIPNKRRKIDSEFKQYEYFSKENDLEVSTNLKVVSQPGENIEEKDDSSNHSIDSLEERNLSANPDVSSSSMSDSGQILYVNSDKINVLHCEEESGNEADVSDIGLDRIAVTHGAYQLTENTNCSSSDSFQIQETDSLIKSRTNIFESLNENVTPFSDSSTNLPRPLRSRSANFGYCKSVVTEKVRLTSSAKYIVFTKSDLDNQENISHSLNAEKNPVIIPEKFTSTITSPETNITNSESSSNSLSKVSKYNKSNTKKTLIRRKSKTNPSNETKSLPTSQKLKNIPEKKPHPKTIKTDVRQNKTVCSNRNIIDKNKNKSESTNFRQDTFVVEKEKNINKIKAKNGINKDTGGRFVKMNLAKIDVPQKLDLVEVTLKKNTIKLEEMPEAPKPLNDQNSRPTSSELKKNVIQLPALPHETSLKLTENPIPIIAEPLQKLEKCGPKLCPLEISDTKTDDPFLTAAKQMQELLNLDLTPTFPTPVPHTRPKTAPCTPLEPEKKSNITLPDINKHKLSAPSSRKISKTNSNVKIVRKLSNANKLAIKKPHNEPITSPVIAKPIINVDELPIITKYTRDHITPGVDDPKEIENIKNRIFLHSILTENSNKNDKNSNNAQELVVDSSKDLEENMKALNDNFEFIENLINENSTISKEVDENIDETQRRNEINLDSILVDIKIDESYIINPDLINSVDNLPIPEELKSSDMYSLEYDKQIDAFENVSKTPPANVLDTFAESDLGALLASALGQISPGESAKSSNFLSSANPITYSTPPQKNPSSYLKKSVSVEPLAKPRHLRNKEDVEKFLGVKDNEKLPEKDSLEDERFGADELFDINDQLYEEYKQYEQMYLEEKRKSNKMGPSGDPTSTDEYLSDRSKNGNESLKPSGDSAYSRSPQRFHSQRSTRNQNRPDHCPSSSGSDISLQAVSLGQKSSAIHKSMLNSISNAPHESFTSNELSDELLNTICDPHDMLNSNIGHGKRSGIPTPINSAQTQSTTDLARHSRNSSMSENSNDSASQQRFSKFCHECGSKFPVTMAKFCVECGVKRLVL